MEKTKESTTPVPRPEGNYIAFRMLEREKSMADALSEKITIIQEMAGELARQQATNAELRAKIEELEGKIENREPEKRNRGGLKK